MTPLSTPKEATTAKPLTTVRMIEGRWSVYSASDRYLEHPHYRSTNEADARRVALAVSRWIFAGCPRDGSRPLCIESGAVFRQRDFDARVAERLGA